MVIGPSYTARNEKRQRAVELRIAARHTRVGAGGLFDRDRYVSPTSIFGQMQVAYDAAANDDVVSGIVESTESLAFNRMSVDCEDQDESNLWEQIQEDLDLDARLREMWREDFIVSQFICGVWWGQKTYKLKGKSDQGITRKKVFTDLQVPLGITILDPMKIVPVGNRLGQGAWANAALARALS